MKGSLLCALFCVLTVQTQADSFSSGVLLGPWSDGTATTAWYSDLQVGPFEAGAFGFSVPAGSGLLNWDSFSAQLYGLGLNYSRPSWSFRFLTGVSPHFDITTFWGPNQVIWEFSPSLALLAVSQTGPWIWGFGDLELSGQAHVLGEIELGGFQADLRVLFFGLPYAGVFLAEQDARFASSLKFLGWSPVDAQGTIKTRIIGFWARETWGFGDWGIDLFLAGGLLWATAGSWEVTTNSFSITLFPPSVTQVSSPVNYVLTANPAWGVLLRPALTWVPVHGWKLMVSRWLFFSGNWNVSSGSGVAAAPPSSGSAGPSELSSPEVKNGLLAGINLELTTEW